MHVCVVGTGYVGLVTGACLAEMGHIVTCVDSDENKILSLRNSLTPSFYEPGLCEIIQRTATTESGYLGHYYLNFSTSLIEELDKGSQIIFICVGTPSTSDGRLDLSDVESVCKDIGNHSTQAHVVIKSTVPPGTCRVMYNLIEELRVQRDSYFMAGLMFNPEFLKEGHAVEDFRRPDRIIVGSEKTSGLKDMRELYSHFIRNGHTYLEMKWESAELSKLASNGMLATRISFMNEMAKVCEDVEGDILELRKGVGSDSRIGMQFLYAGLGFGGSCFPKDVSQLAKLVDEPSILFEVIQANERTKLRFASKIMQSFDFDDLDDYVLAIWGLSFKPKTDDLRKAPALWLIKHLLPFGFRFRVYDPVVRNLPIFDYDARVQVCATKYDACAGAHALVLCTEWAEFRKPDWGTVALNLLSLKVFDGRNQWDPEQMERLGFEYYSIGRSRV